MTIHRRIAVLAVFSALLVWVAPARAGFFAGGTVDGPNAAIQQLSGLAVARDGTGGLVEVRQEGGVNHVFVSRLVNGAFLPPERIDASLPAGSSQPTIAAGDGGELHVAWINDGNLYVIDRGPAPAGWAAPILIYGGGVSDPDIALSIHDKGYLAFAAPGPGGHDIRVARWKLGRWAVIPTPLDAHVEDDVGTGTARVRVAASGDGQAVVVWGEAGSVIARRVWDLSPSVTFAIASLPDLEGHAGGAADLPEVGVGDDSAFALVTFRQRFAQGSGTFARGIARRLRGSAFDDPLPVDGLSFPVGEDAGAPSPSVDNHAAALVATTLSLSHQTWGAVASDDVALNAPARLDTISSTTFTQPVAALGRDDFGVVAWQYDAGLGGAQVVGRQWDGASFGDGASMSDPALGPTDANAGLFASPDRVGDVVVAFVQGVGAARRIVAGGFDKPPGVFAGRTTQQWTKQTQPTLKWSQPTDLWGGITYTVTIDGQPVGTTALTHIIPPRVPDGEHHWSVVATDRHGQQTLAPASVLRVDSTAPTASLRVSGHRQAGKLVRFTVRAADPQPAVTPGAAAPVAVRTSGVRTVRIDFGDHSVPVKGKQATHRYRRGSYTARVTVIDRAGNVTVATQKLRISR